MLVLTFRIGDNRLALDIRRVREVVPRVELRKAPAGPAWLAGMFIYRGKIVPVIDLHRLLGDGDCPAHLSSRIILVPSPQQATDAEAAGATSPEDEPLVGLLAAQVADLREVQASAGLGQLARLGGDLGQQAFGTTLVDGEGILHLVDLDRLLPGSPSSLALLPPSGAEPPGPPRRGRP